MPLESETDVDLRLKVLVLSFGVIERSLVSLGEQLDETIEALAELKQMVEEMKR